MSGRVLSSTGAWNVKLRTRTSKAGKSSYRRHPILIPFAEPCSKALRCGAFQACRRRRGKPVVGYDRYGAKLGDFADACEACQFNGGGFVRQDDHGAVYCDQIVHCFVPADREVILCPLEGSQEHKDMESCDPSVSDPVIGYDREGTRVGPFNNPCLACREPAVAYYEKN